MPKGTRGRATCSIAGCEKSVQGDGWCAAHYRKWKLWGDPLGHAPPKELRPAAGRFWAKVNKDGPIPAHRPELGPCWVWMRAKSRGYGRFKVDGRTVCAYVWAYEDAHGLVPDGLVLDHICHNAA